MDDSLKTTARSKRGKGVRRRVVSTAAIPGNWHSFLRVDENRMEIFGFITQIGLKWFDEQDKQLVITDGEGVHSKPPLEDLTLLSPCNHEKAGSHMLLHAHVLQSTATTSHMLLHTSRAAKHGHHKSRQSHGAAYFTCCQAWPP